LAIHSGVFAKAIDGGRSHSSHNGDYCNKTGAAAPKKIWGKVMGVSEQRTLQGRQMAKMHCG